MGHGSVRAQVSDVSLDMPSVRQHAAVHRILLNLQRAVADQRQSWKQLHVRSQQPWECNQLRAWKKK